MAFGFSPKHEQELPLDDLSAEQFLILSIEAVKKLDCYMSYISETGFIAFTKMSMSSWSEQVKLTMKDNAADLQSECMGNQVVDWGKNKKNIENLINAINELKAELSPDELTQRYEALKPDLLAKEGELFSASPAVSKDKFRGFLAIFKPTQGYFITPLLINLNILLFILMVISGGDIMQPDSATLLKWGGNFRSVTLDGEWWRLLTCCFLHIGILHLLMNMYALLYIGLLLEPHLGKTRFISAYLITGVAASLSSLWWQDFTISAGASGAIFGMYGVFLALLTTNLLGSSVKQAFMTSIVVFIAFNIINGLKPDSGIDNAAHIGGLLSGLLTGYAFVPGLKNEKNAGLNYATIGILIVILLISCSVVYKKLPNDIGMYDKKIEQFSAMENRALLIYNMPEGTPEYKMLAELRDSGIYYWNESLKLIESMDDLDLPQPLKKQNNKLKEYCELRIKCYELMYKGMDEGTDQYTDEVDNYNLKINNLITDLQSEN